MDVPRGSDGWCGFELGPLLLLPSLPSADLAAQTDQRVVVATDVACRVSAGTSSAAVASLQLGRTGRVVRRQGAPADSGSAPVPSGGSTGWLLLDSPWHLRPCWVHASLTAPFDRSRPEEALLAVADHILASDDRPFEEYVQAENLFLDPPWRVVPDSVPVLALRRLQLVDAAVSTERRWEIEKDPLKYAWILAHEDELVYNEPGGNWYAARDRYWELFERFRDEELAEEIAWIAASRPLLGECEGYPGCQLSFGGPEGRDPMRLEVRVTVTVLASERGAGCAGIRGWTVELEERPDGTWLARSARLASVS